MTEPQWLRVVAVWAQVWPDRPLPPTSVGVWFELLSDLDGDDVMLAMRAWANDPERPWPPRSPGELRGAVAPQHKRGYVEALAELAHLVSRHGWGAPLPDAVARDPVLASYVASFGGWRALCEQWDVTSPSVRAQFREHYERMQEDQRRARAAYSRGLPEGSSSVLPALGEGSRRDRP
jgi:hypothetical protein